MMALAREQLSLETIGGTFEIENPGHDNPAPARNTGIGRKTKVAFALALLALLLVMIGIAVATYYFTEESKRAKMENAIKNLDVRLPDTLVPIYYKLDVIPYVQFSSEAYKNFTLQGTVWIDVKCVKATSRIFLHSQNIRIQEETVTITEIEKAELPLVTSENITNQIKIEAHDYDDKRQFYKILLGSTLKPDKIYRIFIEYNGVLDDSMAGFYRSSYFDKESNKTRYIAATQFEATDARKAFPCFDEPALKAKFEVSIARRSNMTSISNMDLRSSEPIPNMKGWFWDHYKKSVPMSTYLVAMVVSDFESTSSDQFESKPEFRIWARKSAIQQTDYAKEIGPLILNFFEGYFGIDYPLPKQDLIAIPDFGSGAMENWGLITFRESTLLYDKTGSSDESKLFIATCVSHELSHQWFGNLVTPKWWNDLWLNEGFATYAENVGMDHVNPDWKMMEYFVTDKVHQAFKLDALDSSHPISVPVHNPHEISQLFDQIAYKKAASVIRMMNHVLTEASFKKGLHNYLKKWSYQAVDQNDLWDSLTEQARSDGTLDTTVTVADVMNSWTLQKGFPVIDVIRNYLDNSVTFIQRKFQLSKNPANSDEDDSYKWWVPISYASKSENTNFQNTQPSFWLRNNETSTSIPNLNLEETSWLIINVQETGFYRVNYDTKNWELITNQLSTSHYAIHLVNRAQLIDDAINLARADKLDYKLAFNLIKYIKDDNDYLPWDAFKIGIDYIGNMLSKTATYGYFKDFVHELIDNQLKRVGFMESSPESFLMRMHRITIVKLACEMDHKGCVDKAVGLFTFWMKKADPDRVNPIPTNLRKIFYCAAIKHGGQKEWDFLWERYMKSNLANEKSTMLQGMSCSRDQWIMNRFLLYTITDESGIRKQDSVLVFKMIAKQDTGSQVGLNFIIDNWLDIEKRFGEMKGLPDVVRYISTKLNTQLELDQLEDFKTKYEGHLDAVSRSVDQAIEFTEANIKWMEKYYKIISDWLKTRMESSDIDEK